MRTGAAISRWQAGLVDRTNEHFELRYGSATQDGWNDWIPMAVIGPPVDRVVSVQFLVKLTDPKIACAVVKVRKDIEYYLLEKQEPNPWLYAQYHCDTNANVYGIVHWSFFNPKETSSIVITLLNQ